MKFKNNLIVSSFHSNNDLPFLPEEDSSIKNQVKAEKIFSSYVAQMKELDSTLRFDYSKAPFLIVKKDGAPILVGNHPKMRENLMGQFSCFGAILNTAYADKETLDLTHKLTATLDYQKSDFIVSNQLENNEFKDELTKSLAKIKHKTETKEDYDYINSIGKFPKTSPLAVPAAALSGSAHSLDQEINIERTVLSEAIKNTVNPSPELLAEQELLNKSHLKNLKRMNDNSDMYGITIDWLEGVLKEKELRVKEAQSVHKKLPFLNDIVVADKYNKELIKFKTGGDNVSINKSALNNEGALVLAAEVAFKNKIHPVHIKVSNSIPEGERGMIVDKLIDAASQFYDLNSIIVPKEFQHLLDDRKLKELNVVSFGAGVDAPEATVEEKNEEAAVLSSGNEAAPVATPKPVAGEPAVKEKKIVNGCFIVPSKNGDVLLYGFVEQIKNLDAAIMKEVIVNLCVAENITPEMIKGCWSVHRPENVDSKFMNNLSEIKKSNNGEDLSFRLAYDVLQDIKSGNFNLEKSDISGFDVPTDFENELNDTVSVEETREMTSKGMSIEETEEELAELFNVPEVLDSEAYDDLVSARNEFVDNAMTEIEYVESKDNKILANGDIDYSNAISEFENIKNKSSSNQEVQRQNNNKKVKV